MERNLYAKYVINGQIYFVPLGSVNKYMLDHPSSLMWDYSAELIIDQKTGKVKKSRETPV